MIMDSLLKDIRYAIRGLAKRPGFVAGAVLTLALGIGVNSALFTVFNAFVLKPLPLKDPESLVNFDGADSNGRRLRLFSYSDFQDYRNRKEVVSDVIAWNRLTLTLGEAPPTENDDSGLPEGYEHLFGQIVSDNYFTMLGADMELGRGFGPTEGEHPGTSPVVVLSHAFWQRRFQADPSIVGKTITLRGIPFKVVGVTARDFVGTTPDVPSFWVPLMMRDELIKGWGHGGWLTNRNTEVFALIGRLAPGVTRRQAQAALQLTTTQLAQAYPGETRKTVLTLTDGGTFVSLDEDVMPIVTPLVLGFGLILLIACANVANLLLTRSAGRQREIAVRLALGASRGRVVRQLVTESVVLALAGGFAGLIVAVWTLSTLYPIVLSSFPLPPDLANAFHLNLTPDWRIFSFTLVLATVAGIAAGLVPAFQASKPDLIESMKGEGSALSGSLAHSRLRNALVVAQIAVCFAILVSAGLLVKSAHKLETADLGMTTKNVFGVAVNLNAQADQQPVPELAARLRDDLAQQLRTVPGVVSVSQVYRQPLSGQMGNLLVSLGTNAGERLVESRFNFVSADYFNTVSLPILRGRAFTAEEVKSKVPVVVVSDETAKRFWPGNDALGQHIGIADTSENVDLNEGDPSKRTYRQYEVIGVARDTRNRWVWQKDDKFIYIPLQPTDSVGQYLLVLTKNDPGSFVAQTRNLVQSIHPQLRASIKTINQNLAFQTAPFRAVAWLSSVLGVLALILSCVGLYGVIAFMVASRTREIGIRAALGAKPTDIVRMFTLQGLKLTFVGMICGLAGGAAIARLLATVLIDLSSIDPIAYGSVAAFLIAVAFIAILLPARRATKVDPLVALRYE
jgi:predicted permease